MLLYRHEMGGHDYSTYSGPGLESSCMEFGQYQMQIFVSLVVTLGAAFVALICDLLKGNNEQLRELAIELKVRREEETKRFQMLAPRAMQEAGAATLKVEAPVPAPHPAQKTEAAEPQVASSEQTNRKRSPLKGSRDEKKRAIAPEALAAMQRGEQLAASPRPRRTPDRVSVEQKETQQMPVPQSEPRSLEPVEPVEMVAELQPAVEVLELAKAPAAKVTAAGAPAARTGSPRDWSSLLSVRHAPPPARKASRSIPVEPALPAGFQDGFVLTRLVESRQPVSGLVVSIGASEPHNQTQNQSVLASTRGLIQSLLGPNDFGAQSGKEEFLLIYPGERGASAQRKLRQIAEQLWDFQLRSMGALSIQFSWGGVEVRSESIDEAIASATERMQQTRRGRKILTMEARPAAEEQLRRAV